MEITTLPAAVAGFGLPCNNPELRDYPAQDMPWPAAYVRSIDGHNIIALREGIRDDAQRGLRFSCMSCCVAGCTRIESDAESRSTAFPGPARGNDGSGHDRRGAEAVERIGREGAA